MHTTSILDRKVFRFICYLALFVSILIYGDIKLIEHTEIIESKQELTYHMAEYDNLLEAKGYKENGHILSDSNLIINDIHEEILVAKVEEPQVIEQEVVSRGLPRNITNIFTQPTGLTADEFNVLIEDIAPSNSKLLGLGDAFVSFEETYELNGIYAIAITFESGYGVHINGKNNFVGATGSSGKLKNYNTPADCIMDLGNFLTNRYVSRGKTTISRIAPTYCPPNSVHWTNSVNDGFNKLVKIANTF